VLDKPIGLSSMSAVAAVRRRAGGVRTGHAGTLDPLATGVLVMALGRATKAINQLMATDKRYCTVIDLSAFTSTGDREGERQPVDGAPVPDEPAVRRVLEGFVGTIQQRPPAFSAMKVNGTRAYALARRGQPVDLAPRTVLVHRIALVSFAWPLVELDIWCGKGFYVRGLARDLGAALGTGGHCAIIRRTAVGPFTIDEASRLEDLPAALGPETMMSLEAALARVHSAEVAPG
jgi:tRNA pseudouridine55 synthase